jgi:hypothetical protein
VKKLNARAWLALAVLVVEMGLLLFLLFVAAGTVSLLASMGILVDLHGRVGPHCALSHEKGPGAP